MGMRTLNDPNSNIFGFSTFFLELQVVKYVSRSNRKTGNIAFVVEIGFQYIKYYKNEPFLEL